MDDMQYLSFKAKNQGIDARQIRTTKKMIIPEQEQIDASCQEIKEILADGYWHKCLPIRAICKKHKLSFHNVAELLLIAVSDRGMYCCIVQDHTPLHAPDELPPAA